MLSQASEATVTQEDIDYLLNDAYPILMDTKNLANLLEQVDTSAISPENGEEWKPLIQEISDEAERLCGLFEKTTPSPNFEDFHTLMVTGYRCFSSSMDLIIQSEGEDMDKMMLAVDYMLKGNTYITSANEFSQASAFHHKTRALFYQRRGQMGAATRRKIRQAAAPYFLSKKGIGPELQSILHLPIWRKFY